GDIDNDGFIDVFVANYGPNKLYRNNGDSTFTDISQKAGIHNSAWGTAAVLFDYDRDGFLDIFVANYVTFDPPVICTDKAGKRDYCGPQAYQGEPDVLYHNNRDGTFTDVSMKSGIGRIVSKGLGVVAADFDMDHWPDIYVANDGEPNQLWINQHNGTFIDVALPLGAAVNAAGQAEAGMGIALGDIDADNDPDLFITHLRGETNTLFRHAGKSGFQDDTASSGIAAFSLPYTGFGTGYFDFDHDGDLDVAVVNGRVTRGPLLTKTKPPKYWDHYAEPNLLYENDGSGRFTARNNEAGTFASDIENSRGLAFGDVDNDGDIDLLVTNDGGPAQLYRNDVKDKGHWLSIRAKDPLLKRDAIGASITVTVGGKNITRFVAPAYSYLSSNDPRVHFGLGKATLVDQILIVWPDGSSEKFEGVKADQFLILEKGKGNLP
ncbi:MAG TPA: CRTAC1 family protein, partial [Acidobacteriota bacterium]|nr:CRTAC1 family protein [Acidobacteriota bacterium]